MSTPRDPRARANRSTQRSASREPGRHTRRVASVPPTRPATSRSTRHDRWARGLETEQRAAVEDQVGLDVATPRRGRENTRRGRCDGESEVSVTPFVKRLPIGACRTTRQRLRRGSGCCVVSAGATPGRLRLRRQSERRPVARGECYHPRVQRDSDRGCEHLD